MEIKKEQENGTLALFDFDGTITRGDSFLRFILFSNSLVKVAFKGIVLCPVLVLYKLGLIPNGRAKEIIFSFFYKNLKEKTFFELATAFAHTRLPGMLRNRAEEKLLWHLGQGHTVIIITASVEHWIKPWADLKKIGLVGTRIEVKNGMITGKFTGQNCFGKEKVARLKELIRPEDFSYIYAYGDSEGDKEFMQLADEKYWRPFRK